MDPSLLTLTTSSLETLVNTALRYDPASRQQLAALTEVLAIRSTAPNVTLYCRGSEDGIRIMGHCELPITTQLTGSPLALLSLLKQPSSLAGSGVELSGSVGLLQQWQAVIQQLDIDWEDAISSMLGDTFLADIAVPMFTNNVRKGAAWAHNQQEQQLRLLKDYLSEELTIAPSKTELNDFYQQITELSMNTDRLSARLNNLIDKLNTEEGKPE